jgi:Fanconi anemia group M protein
MRPTKSRRSSGGSYRSRSSNGGPTAAQSAAGEGPRRRDWFPSAGEMVTLVADAAQKGNAILAALSEKKVRIVYANLQIGDFQITDNVYVTYMTSEDFVRGLADKRLYRQVLELKRSCPEPVLIVEGPNVYELKEANAYVINGALAFMSVLNRVPVIFTGDAEESADILFMATNQMQFGLGFEVHAEDQKKKKREFKEIQLDVLSALPGVGPTIAKALVKQYGSLQGIFAASAEDLAGVNGFDDGQVEILSDLFEFKA